MCVSLDQHDGIGLFNLLLRVTMQFVVRDADPMIVTPIQRDVDGIAKGAHEVLQMIEWLDECFCRARLTVASHCCL